MAIKDNEAIYDDQIAPLMTQVIAICKEHKIPMVASFEYDSEKFCTTVILEHDAAPNLKAAAGMIRNGFAAATVTTRAKAGAK